MLDDKACHPAIYVFFFHTILSPAELCVCHLAFLEGFARHKNI